MMSEIFAGFKSITRLEISYAVILAIWTAIAKRIVELHQGRIWVEDNPAGGAIFCVGLPKAAETGPLP
jgi:K+-sensing histidine kinase KdpD